MTILSSCLDIDSVREYPPSTLANSHEVAKIAKCLHSYIAVGFVV